MPRTKRKKAATEGRTVTRKRRVSAGHEPNSEVNTEPTTCKAVFVSERTVKTDRNGESGVDHAEQIVGAAAAPQQSQQSSGENKSDDDRGINDAAAASQGTIGECGLQTVATSRKERIRHMVEHRKQLLHRVRLGRTSVVKRIATQPASNITTEQEIARFHDMIKTVNAEIRKQQQQAQHIQKQQDNVDRRSAARRGSAAQKRGSAISTVASPEDLEVSMRTDATGKTKRSVVASSATKRRVVICAETAALRERRNALLAKLKCPRAKNPTPLPQRRQTHWDTLLQEMAWVATDFREERKWKVAAARWTGNEIVQAATKPTNGSSGSNSQASNESIEPEQENETIEELNSVAKAKEEPEIVPEVVSETSDTALEENPSIDEAQMRQSSSTLSQNVIEFLQGNIRQESQADEDEDMDSSAPKNTQMAGLHAENPTEYVDRILESMKKDLQNERRSRSEAYGQKLTEHQVQAVRAVEDRWHRIRVGACLRGPVSAGKTITACSLLWRHRAQGTSLVICKLENVIRWIHELGRFSDLKPCVWDPEKNSSTSSNSNVHLCTHSTVCQVSVEQLKRFHTIVVDKRYPNGFCGSRLAVEHEDISTTAPLEFADIEWWTKLASTSSNRVVVEKSEPSFGFLRNASNRQRLSILALYMGFLLGTRVFESKRFVLEKSILAWGRHRIKNEGQSNESKYQRIYTLFTSICDAFHCQVEGKETLESSIATSDAWDVRQCDMSHKQTESYIRACADVRSTLSGSVPCGDDSAESRCIAGAFMQLRKHVFHADLSDSIQCLQPTVVRGSSSQPDLAKAQKIMASSGKLQALVSIIVQEFQYRFNNGSGDVRVLFDEQKFKRVKPSSADVHRLVILASHPEILTVVSGLLSLIGIEHDRLSSGFGGSQNEGRTIQSQLLLSKFNGESKCSEESSVQKILVAAPCAIATDFGGLGVEKADAVLLLDEDWSGAEELVLQALSTRCNFQRTSSELEPCRFIRLVSKGTCESHLLEQSNVSDFSSHTSDASAKQGWVCPIAPSGRYVPPELRIRGKGNLAEMYLSRPLSPGTFSFPGFTLFCLAGSPLDAVLGDCPEISESSLFFQEEVLYCPRDSLNQRMQTVYWLQEEERGLMQDGHTRSYGSVHFSCVEQRGTAFSQLYTGKLPCREFLRHAFGGQDAVESYEPLPSDRSMPMSTKSAQTQNQPSITQLQRGDVTLNQPIQTMAAVAESVLFYKPPGELQLAPNKRANLFAASFGADRQDSIIFDGNQGSEPLVYFPPLFPRIRECGVLARRDVSALQSQMYPIPIQMEDVGTFSSGADSSKSMEHTNVHRVVTEDEASRSDAASVLIDISDDFGLVGMGAVPLPRDSALAASSQATATHSKCPNVPTPYSWGDFQEIEQTELSGANSVLLLTSRKRQRKHAPASAQQVPRGSMNGSYAAPIATLPPIQEGSTKKFKAAPVLLSRPSLSGVSMVSHASAKDVRLHSLLNNLRQYGRGSMFEAPIYRVASIRVRNKIADRLVRHAWEGAAFEEGPGLPLMVYKQHPGATTAYRGLFDVDSNLWTSIVKRLSSKEAVTGGEAVELSIGQRNSLRRSLVSPCRVDFGPFQSGFVSSTTGATVGAPQRSRVGVSLPMGVKIPPSSKDQLPLPWTQDDDRRLHEAAVRTGMNWILTAAELSGFKDITIAAKSESRNYHLSRSARTCRDRWQRLARNNPSMVVKVRQSERYWSSFNQFPENDGDSGTCLPVQGDECTTLLARSTKRNKEPVGSTSRTFHAVRTAKIRRQTALPLQIPGVAPGAQPTTSSPHQSHEQAIKTSVAASWTGGRTDMWPLHLLDAADRADAAARHSARTDQGATRR